MGNRGIISSAVLVAAVMAALGACAGDPEAPPATTSSSTSSSSSTSTTATTSTTTPAPSPTSTTPADDRLKVGTTWTSPDGAITVTVSKILNPVKTSPIDGEQLAGALVRSCVKKMPAGL